MLREHIREDKPSARNATSQRKEYLDSVENDPLLTHFQNIDPNDDEVLQSPHWLKLQRISKDSSLSKKQTQQQLQMQIPYQDLQHENDNLKAIVSEMTTEI